MRVHIRRSKPIGRAREQPSPSSRADRVKAVRTSGRHKDHEVGGRKAILSTPYNAHTGGEHRYQQVDFANGSVRTKCAPE
jgi:hypothetical protein